MTTRKKLFPEICALAFDHRRQFEELADRTGGRPERIATFKALIGEVVASLNGKVDGLGAIVDDRFGGGVLDRLTGTGTWLARPVELPGSRPLAFEDSSGPALALRSWPTEHVAKCLVYYDVADAKDLRGAQEAALIAVQNAARATGREWLLELIPPGGGRSDEAVLASMRRFYEIGLKPDWWKLPPTTDREAWKRIGDLIRAFDPHVRGVILLGLDSSEADLGRAFSASAEESLVRGFAVGRAIFWPSAERWFEGRASDLEAIAEIRSAFLRIVDRWRSRQDADPEALRAVDEGAIGRCAG